MHPLGPDPATQPHEMAEGETRGASGRSHPGGRASQEDRTMPPKPVVPPRGLFTRGLAVAVLGLLPAGASAAEPAPPDGLAGPTRVGVRGPVGCRDDPKVVDRLEITRPGVYENYL